MLANTLREHLSEFGLIVAQTNDPGALIIQNLCAFDAAAERLDDEIQPRIRIASNWTKQNKWIVEYMAGRGRWRERVLGCLPR